MSSPPTPPTEQPRRRGRPPTTSVVRRAAAQAARETGKLPHEILLDIARGTPLVQPTMVWDEDTQSFKNGPPAVLVPDMQQRMAAARDAAPYFAPKLSAVELLMGLSDAELDDFIALAAAEAGIGVGAAGEGPAPQAPTGPAGPSPDPADPVDGD